MNAFVTDLFGAETQPPKTFTPLGPSGFVRTARVPFECPPPPKFGKRRIVNADGFAGGGGATNAIEAALEVLSAPGHRPALCGVVNRGDIAISADAVRLQVEHAERDDRDRTGLLLRQGLPPAITKYRKLVMAGGCSRGAATYALTSSANLGKILSIFHDVSHARRVDRLRPVAGSSTEHRLQQGAAILQRRGALLDQEEVGVEHRDPLRSVVHQKQRAVVIANNQFNCPDHEADRHSNQQQPTEGDQRGGDSSCGTL
ncbi:hypothetical protein U8P68_10775 [Rhizobium ruizarguesonis]|nr:hypothetical protein U8P68_10775 [Rhizobium ruizarguesonis]